MPLHYHGMPCSQKSDTRSNAAHENLNSIVCPAGQLLSLDGASQRTACELLIPASPGTAAAATTSAATATAASSAATALSLEGVGCALCSLLERLLVRLDEARCLVREAESQGLETRQLDALAEDDGAVDLVESGANLLVRDHLADDGADLALAQLEHVRQRGDGECVVVRRVCEKVGPQALFLDLCGQHVLDLLRVGHEFPDFDAVDELGSLLPLAGRQRLGGLHDVVAGVLGGTGEDLALMVF